MSVFYPFDVVDRGGQTQLQVGDISFYCDALRVVGTDGGQT